MKKLSKKDEALDVVRQMVADGQISQEVAEKYCPEIKKYKDEIVKKQILELIRQHSVNANRCMMENWVCDHVLLQPFKPSDEQMAALNYVVNLMASSERPTENDLYYNILKSLREQLNKLREE